MLAYRRYLRIGLLGMAMPIVATYTAPNPALRTETVTTYDWGGIHKIHVLNSQLGWLKCLPFNRSG